ncbi:MAG: hypothetical protein NTW74_14345 [Acidobacteria bacterium]|nr:hypothetical protein [Acidobacteriota bacterium]
MWNQLKEAFTKGRLFGTSQQGQQPRAKISIAGQKWLGPGESMRVLEVEIDGTNHKLVVWNSAKSSQILELTSVQRAREAVC